jgi:hypothetical protein
MNTKQDDALIQQFENATLPLESFHHTDHVHLAFLYLQKFPLLEVLQRFPAALARYAAAHNKHGLYHETITWAYIFLIRERQLRSSHPQTWPEFQSQNPDLLTWKNGILTKYYSQELLHSAPAKASFLLPDKLSTAMP